MDTAVVIGIGEMGGVFARGLLRSGIVVAPVTRESDAAEVSRETPEPEIVLVAVGEDDLDPVLAALPESWRPRCGLIQNELVPDRWTRHGIADPTVAAVWFEKKPGRDVMVILPTPVAGPAASLLVTALHRVDIPAVEVDPARIVDELVVKNLYILTANIAGLRTGGTVGELWDEHRAVAEAVATEVLAIQEHLVGSHLDGARLVAAMAAAFAADPGHGATGRSAPRRLQRALRTASAAEIATPTLRAIAAAHGITPDP